MGSEGPLCVVIQGKELLRRIRFPPWDVDASVSREQYEWALSEDPIRTSFWTDLELKCNTEEEYVEAMHFVAKLST